MEGVKLNDRYRLVTCIGSGGMAMVYEGLDMLLERRVAVKVLRHRFAGDPEFLERFQREARAAASLDHPNIVTVFDVGRDGDRHYIVMEYVDGQDLKTLIRQRGRLDVAQAVDVATQVARGVGHAHQAGFIHRDIKPQNVLITQEGMAKVVDFGIARALSESGLTDSDTVWGSPIYFAPEQAAGEKPTPASDVYSIGIVMYEMLAGSPPFRADNPTALAMKHLREEPPPLLARNPQVPPRLEWIVRKILSKEPAARYRTAEQLAHVLEDYRLQVEQPTGWQPAVTAAPSHEVSVESPSASEPVPVHAGALSVDGWTWVLTVIAFVAVVGLIPLWWLVYRSYASLPTTPPTLTSTPLVARTAEADLVVVPQITNRPTDEARRMLQRSGLEMDIKEEQEAAGHDEGTVLEQDPPAGENVPTGGTVSVVIAGPGRELTVPDVTGQTADEMREGLESMNLEVIIQETWSAEAGGMVMSQEPQPGATVRAGDRITLTVSTGSDIALEANLDDRILLKGAVLEQNTFERGEMLGVTFRWKALSTIEQRYAVFIHLMDADGNLVAQDDGQPHLPTTEWTRGMEIVDPHQLTIPPETPVGEYQLRVGMYPAGEPGNRLPVVDPGRTEQTSNSILVVAFEVRE